MKNKMRHSIMTVMVVGMTVSGAAGVYAGSNMEEIKAYLNSSIGFSIDGAAYYPTDANGNKLTPITYQDSTYLPVRALADALKVPLDFDAKNNQVLIGSTTPVTSDLSDVNYNENQTLEIQQAFTISESYESSYAPKLMVTGDSYQKTVATDDGVNLIFTHMIIHVSPKDYSDGYDSKVVTLSNGTQAKWYTPVDTPLLSFKLDDRTVTISSRDHSLSNTQIEKLAVSVAKLTK